MRLQNRCITVVIELCVVQFWSEILLCLKLPLCACLILKSGQITPQLAQLPLFIWIFVIVITIVTIIITNLLLLLLLLLLLSSLLYALSSLPFQDKET